MKAKLFLLHLIYLKGKVKLVNVKRAFINELFIILED
nr:MAG TPA: hypothetical protein [Caudoviricetes sp.]